MKQLCLTFFLLPFLLCGQETLSLQLSSDSILIGEPLFITVSRENAPKNWLNLGLKPADTNWIMLNQSLDSNAFLTKQSWIKTLELTRFDSGYHLLNLLPVYSDSLALRLEARFVYVGFPEPEPNIEIKDIKNIRKAPFDWWRWAIIPAIILGLLSLLIYLIFKLKLKKKPTQDSFDSTLTPRELALKTLDNIEKSALWQKGAREFYTDLTDVLREYLETVYHIPAMEMSGTELAGKLINIKLKTEDQLVLKQYLLRADAAKYAENFSFVENPLSEVACIKHFIVQYPESNELATPGS